MSHDEALDVDLTLYATRYRPLPSEAAVLEDAIRAIENRWPDAERFEGDLTTLSVEGRSPALSAAYRVRIGDEDKLTLALVTHRGGWGFKARATGPSEDPVGVSFYARVLLEGALMAREEAATGNP